MAQKGGNKQCPFPSTHEHSPGALQTQAWQKQITNDCFTLLEESLAGCDKQLFYANMNCFKLGDQCKEQNTPL